MSARTNEHCLCSIIFEKNIVNCFVILGLALRNGEFLVGCPLTDDGTLEAEVPGLTRPGWTPVTGLPNAPAFQREDPVLRLTGYCLPSVNVIGDSGVPVLFGLRVVHS